MMVDKHETHGRDGRRCELILILYHQPPTPPTAPTTFKIAFVENNATTEETTL